MRLRRLLGVPFLYAVSASAVGFSIYFSIGVVADRGLGLTPLIFLVAGLMFALTTLTYVEGGTMFGERGGSATFSRYAFNELVSFIAGWAILIDYLIVIAIAAITVPHYLTPISDSFDERRPRGRRRRAGDRPRRCAQHRRGHGLQPPACCSSSWRSPTSACSWSW